MATLSLEPRAAGITTGIEDLGRALTTMIGGLVRPQAFGTGVSIGVLAGIVIGSLVTLWLGDAAVDLIHRIIDRFAGRRNRVNFELLLQ